MSNNSDEIYYFKKFLEFPTIVHGVSTKAYGPITKHSDILKGYKAFAEDLGLANDKIIFMQQKHGGNVSVVSDFSDVYVSDTDALVTGTQSLPLAVLTADCLPILLYDPENGVVAAVHAGYKGLLSNIIGNTVNRMSHSFGSLPGNIIAGIGPAIERDCYDVGGDRVRLFHKTFPSFTTLYTENDGKYFLDLRSIAEQCLHKEGILKEHTEHMDLCTKCDSRFYSYRGGDTQNRFVSIISLV